jgi:ABC-type multidrug transport system permease subunit
VGKIVSELPRTLFLTLEFSIPVYFMVGLHTNFWSFLIFWLIGILVVMVTESMALCVTTMLPNPQAASAFMPVVC